MKPELSQRSLQELTKQRNSLKGAVIGLGIVGLIASVPLIYLVFKTGKYGYLAITAGCFFPLFPSLVRLGQLNNEIKTRNSK